MNSSCRITKQLLLRNQSLTGFKRCFSNRPTSHKLSSSFLGNSYSPTPLAKSPVVTAWSAKNIIWTSQRNYSMSFEEAVKNSTSMKDPDNSTKLKMYALYKQATTGKPTGKRPGAMDFVGRAKYDAWNGLGDMSQEEAKKQYIELVQSGLGDSAGGGGASAGQSSSSDSSADGLDITVADGIRTIRLNRPDKKNALTHAMYRGILNSLKEANDDANTRVIVITGTGDYFCSGNDLGNFANVTDPMKMAKDGRDLLMEYVDAYIYCKKPLVGILNGPAVGISVTVLGLFDAVFTTDKATFTSPFSALGQSPEGCASYTFPRIMGYAKASELLYFNQKITAAEAEKLGLVTQVIPHDRLEAEAWKRVRDIAQLPLKSLVYSKDLVRGRERELLHQVNVAECDRLQERWTSEDCMNAIMKFFSKKSKV
ncbi:Enoyl-CoA delta isomerase 2, mitochondrial [Orchesella cincta]|uniref:Enoyl-CoA delta isomerase 2, mitochondrial n=1 Tax=Orchesella cincta TaxID=48709 RepID=A0A1D2N7H0_ORCCI|nr:Enoyl-CoA delta isomerase 2, mitochondrial [Orchesella cincta]